jgi:hypothetical protein
MAEFIDCGTISIQYDTTGKAAVSFVVVKQGAGSLNKTYSSLDFGGRTFTGSIMSAVQKPIIGSGDGKGSVWFEWQMQLQGVGN